MNKRMRGRQTERQAKKKTERHRRTDFSPV